MIIRKKMNTFGRMLVGISALFIGGQENEMADLTTENNKDIPINTLSDYINR